MNAQIIICDQIRRNEEVKSHTLGTILNQVHIPVLPFVIQLHILVKIVDLPSQDSINMQLNIYDEQDQIIGTTSQLVLRNYREPDMFPGVDALLEVSVVLVKSGNIRIKCFLNDEESAWYPLTIRLDGGS